MTQERQSILKCIEQLLESKGLMPLGELWPNHDLRSDLELESLDIAEVSMNLEKIYDIKITDEDIEGWWFVSDMINTIEHIKANSD